MNHSEKTNHLDAKACTCVSKEEKSDSRRQFLQKAKTITIGAISLTCFPMVLAGEAEKESPDKTTQATSDTESPPLFGFLVNVEKCIGTGKCLAACRVENNVPNGQYRTWAERYIHFKNGTVQVDLVPESGYSNSDVSAIRANTVERSFFVSKLCNHCEHAPCNQVCPTHASLTSPEGIELVDPELCIGCGYCVQACPYGVRFINHDTGNADKCTWCYHRIMRGERPACVEACPVDARAFGRLDDPQSKISKRLAEIPTHVLKEHLGTHPKLYYIGFFKGVT